MKNKSHHLKDFIHKKEKNKCHACKFIESEARKCFRSVIGTEMHAESFSGEPIWDYLQPKIGSKFGNLRKFNEKEGIQYGCLHSREFDISFKLRLHLSFCFSFSLFIEWNSIVHIGTD